MWKMKRTIFIILIFLMSSVCVAQEWFTSFDVAKRLATVQNKMLFVLWEGSFDYEFPVILFNKKGKGEIVDLRTNDTINQMIWEYFVPVKLPEYEYAEFSKQVKETRGLTYYSKLIDDGIKIMDINGNILNIDDSDDKVYFADDYPYLIINEFIKRYALNTSLLKLELDSYSNEKSFATAFRLASKYVDYSIFVRQDLRAKIIDLADIYYDDAKRFLTENDENYVAFLQKLDLEHIKELLILGNPRKARRLLKKMDTIPIDEINQRLFDFLNFTTFKLLEDEENATLWENKLSPLDLKKAELILNINSSIHGKSN